MSMDLQSDARRREVRCAPCPREPTLVSNKAIEKGMGVEWQSRGTPRPWGIAKASSVGLMLYKNNLQSL